MKGAHNREDERLRQILADVTPGFYADVGGYAPDVSSNTLLLYQHGWSGVIVEPLLGFSEDLMRQWKEQRSRDLLAPCVAYHTDDEVLPFYICQSPEGNAAQMSTASQRMIKGWHGNSSQIGDPSGYVRTLTLNSLLGFVTDPHDLKALSIDVEGMEEDVLSGLDLTVWRPWVVVIETMWTGTVERRMNGYRWVHHDSVNEWYVAEEHADRIPLFQLGE